MRYAQKQMSPKHEAGSSGIKTINLRQHTMEEEPVTARAVVAGAGFPDTTDLYWSKGPEVKEFKARAFKYGYEVREGRGPRNDSRKPWLAVYRNNKRMYVDIELTHFGAQWFKRVTVTLSRFPSFTHAYICLGQLLGQHLEFASVVRIDFAVDLLLPTEQVLGNLLILYKRHRDLHIAAGSKSSGFYAGKSPSQVRVYNKSLKDPAWAAIYQGDSKEPPPVTRIEVSLMRDRIPIEHLYELPEVFMRGIDGSRFDPFEGLTLLRNVRMVDEGLVNERGSIIRFTELRALLEFAGFHIARKHLSKNRNFNRDYLRFLEISDDTIDLDGIFHESMEVYLADWKPELRIRFSGGGAI